MSAQATYSPEDNKLRLYVGRVPRDEFEALRKEGWTSTPKQDCDFVAVWTPGREDTAMDYAGEIDDEDQSPEDRAADRAERFGGYRDKRMGEAGASADRFDAGPPVHGYQSQARAERMANRHDRSRVYAVSQWSKAEYWQRRTAGVIAHALHKSSAPVRRSRILRLEAEQRKHLATVEQARKRWQWWKKVAAETDPEQAFKMAYALANASGEWRDYQHPRKADRKTDLYHLLTDTELPITGHEAATLVLERCHADGPGWVGGYGDRWTKHYELRLSYERAMLEAEGGSAGSVEMEPGGFIGKYQVVRVHKSPATKAVVSVTVYTPDREIWGGKKVDLQRINIQRFGESIYRAPTDDERKAFESIKAKLTAKTREANKGKPKLINPTREAAQALQDHLNARELARGKGIYTTAPEPVTVLEMTQAEYTQRSKGSHSSFDSYYLRAGGVLDRVGRDMYSATLDKLPVVCKVRAKWGRVDSIVVLTDKPQSALPDWSKVVKPEAVEVSA